MFEYTDLDASKYPECACCHLHITDYGYHLPDNSWFCEECMDGFSVDAQDWVEAEEEADYWRAAEFKRDALEFDRYN